MADKWPAANGNWSTAANWNGGTKPQPGDDVYADGKTITIDENVSIASLRTTQRSGGTAGGGFTVSASNITIAANMVAGTTVCTTITGTNCTITGSTTGGSGTNAYGTFFSTGSSGSLTGNVTAGAGTSAAGLTSSTVNTVTVNGNIASSATATGCLHTIGTFVVNGNIINTPSSTLPALLISSTTNPIKCTINGNVEGATALQIVGSGPSVIVNSSNPIVGVAATAVITFINVTSSGCGTLELNVPYVIGGSTLGHYVANFQYGTITLNGNCLASSASPAIVLAARANIFINGDVTGTTQPALSVLVNSHGYTVNGTVTGGSTAPGIESAAAAGSPCLVIGEVIGGTTSTGYGISNTGSASILVRGTTTDNTAVAIHNTGTGIVTIDPLIEAITMSCVELLNVTEDDISSEQEITGTFDFQANSPEGGTYYLLKALGASADREKRTDFQLYKQFTGPANLPIDNIGTNRFKVQLVGTKGVADKIVTVNIQD